MKRFLFTLCCFWLIASSEAQPVNIIPQPSLIELKMGSFLVKNKFTIGINDQRLSPAADYLQGILSFATGYQINVQNGKGDLTLTLGKGLETGSAYRLNVRKSGIEITANGYSGIISGISTLRQLLPARIEVSADQNQNMKWTIPAVSITDKPRFNYRGLMLDVSRHFYTKQEVENLLDLMALYKLNKFHWHLTDDQGWRIEIKKYPLLTEKGAWRKYNQQDSACMKLAQEQDNPDFNLPKAHLKIVQGDTLYGGFYTQQDIREVVAYAKVRGIDIIPEVDMPGHFMAAIQNYDHISCFKQPTWGPLFSSPVCPGKERAIEFCKNVYREVFKLFPYEYVHIGGDEVDKVNWKRCPDCQKRMREHGLKTEEELQAWFIKQMEKFFNENGKKLIGWDEILEGGLSPSATIMWWRGWVPKAVPKATASGNRAIISTTDRFYFDGFPDEKTLRNVYDYEPVMKSLNSTQQKLIWGVQANVWTERIPSVARMEYMILPRMLALSEICWSDTIRKNWNRFNEKVKANIKRFELKKINYYVPGITGVFSSNMFVGKTAVKLQSGYGDVMIRYTTDGSFPISSSPLYDKPLEINKTTDFIFRYFYPDGKKGDLFDAPFIKGEYALAKDTTLTRSGLLAIWHEYGGNSCLEIEKAPLNGQYTVEEVAIPGAVKGNIGLVLSGYIRIPADDIYTFGLLSDDGSMLYIDHKKVIDNDGPHSPREVMGMKALRAGWHPVKVLYFDSNGGVLKFKVSDSKGRGLTREPGLFKH